MTTSQLNFRKFRDFGDLLGDTFNFIKFEYKSFLRILMIYAGPFILFTAIASAWFQSGIFSMMSMMVDNDPAEILSEFGLKLIVYMLAAVVSNTMLICVVYSYIQLYIERGKDGFVQEDVWYLVGKKFFQVLGAMVLMGLIIGVGVMLCIIPGIYFAVSFCLVLAVLFFENQSVGNALGRSMSIIRNDFWIGLGLGVVINILVGVISYVFVLPSVVFSMVVSINTLKGNSSDGVNIVYMILVAFGTFGASFLSAIPHITFSLFYHSQIEKTESPGLINKIESINKPESDVENKSRF